MERAETILLRDIDSIFEDAVVFLVISQSPRPVEALLGFLQKYAFKSKVDPGPQPTRPGPEDATLDQKSIMVIIDPVFRLLAKSAVAAQKSSDLVCQYMADELLRLTTTTNEIEQCTRGLYKKPSDIFIEVDNEDDIAQINGIANEEEV